MLRHLVTYIIVLAAGLSARSQAFDVLAGGLSTAGIPSETASLTLRGSLNAADLDWLGNHLKNVGTLDMSGVEIVQWTGRRLAHGVTSASRCELPPYIFAGLHAGKVILPYSLHIIGDGAFMQSRIKSIDIPATVDFIGMAAFSQCDLLSSVTLPTALKCIPQKAFEDCVSLTSLTVPDGISAIGQRAFYGCISLSSVYFPATLSSIGDEAFSHTDIAGAYLAGCTSLRSVGAYAFASCSSLRAVTLPDGLRSLGEGAFWECPSLRSIVLPVDMTTLAPLMFKGDSSLASVGLPHALESMGKLALAGTSVGTVSLPSGLTFIDDNAFENMAALQHIDATRLSEVPSLGSEVWAGVLQDSVSLHVGDDEADAFRAALQWQDFRILDRSQSALVPLEADSYYKVSFDGPILKVESDKPLREVSLFDLDGHRLAAVAGPSDTLVTIDTSPWHTSFFILSVITDGSVRHVLKLIR
ncbi:MAG: leucine-rich repeat domain-containing protein [Duncaniella sp.]|nr:leucine-rich repeat domain-containing protein [Duncaniella sp.]